jgi:hypothetical protein
MVAFAVAMVPFGCARLEAPPDELGSDDDEDDADEDDADDDDADDADDDDDDDPEVAVEDSVLASHNLGSVITTEGQTSANVAVEGVFTASQAAGTGQVVTTGTLTQQGQAFAYAPSPSDRLVVEFGDGTAIDFWIDEIAGDSTSAAAFLNNDHEFQYRVAVDGKIDMTFESRRQAGSLAAGAVGSYVHEGVDYDIDLSMAGAYDFESDSTGTYFRDEHRTTGSITASGYDLDVDETWYFELVTSDSGSAQAATRTVANSLQLGGDTFDWVDVATAKSFRNGKPSEIDTYWKARGEILRNGEQHGTYRLDLGAPAFIHMVVDLPTGPVEVESHAY